MNIEVEGYTKEQIKAALFSSARKVRYEYTITNATGEHLGFAEVENGVISYDSTQEIMRSFSGRIKKSDLINMDCIDYKLVPWMCLMMPNGKEAKFPLGSFYIVPSLQSELNINMVNIVGYDMGKIFSDDKADTRVFVDSTDVYTSIIAQFIGRRYMNFDVEESEYTKSFPQEWDIGTSYLTIINDLLRGINYDPLHFDENGKAICREHVSVYERLIDFQYLADDMSIILDGITTSSDKFDTPNKWIRYTENVDAPYYISVVVNDDDKSPYSVQNRGRMIVDSAVVNDIASQQALDNYTNRIAAEAMQSTERIEFSTLNMPGHDYRECLYVKVPSYDIDGRYIEVAWEMELVSGGQMRHICEKVVRL